MGIQVMMKEFFFSFTHVWVMCNLLQALVAWLENFVTVYDTILMGRCILSPKTGLEVTLGNITLS